MKTIQLIVYIVQKFIDNKKLVNIIAVKYYNKWHYFGLKSLENLLNSKESRTDGRFRCNRCFRPYHNKYQLDNHHCYFVNNTLTKIPENKIIKFEKLWKQTSPPYCIYADIEAIQIKNDTNEKIHKPLAFGMFVLPDNKYYYFDGIDCIAKGLQKIEGIAKSISKDFTGKPMNQITIYEQNDYNNANNCYLCYQQFTHTMYKVRDHCHLSGNFRGAACNNCNLQLRQVRNNLPVFFHNLKGYDMHFIIQNINILNKWSLKVIADSREKYKTMTASIKMKDDNFFNIKFLDSYAFLNRSLEKLSKSMTMRYYTDTLHLPTEIVQSKGILPYSYFTSYEILNEMQLPDINSFHNDLTNEPLSKSDYERALLTWNEMKCETLGDYLHFYLKLDVYLLTDIFEQFRSIIKKDYNLDPANYIGIPSLTIDAALKWNSLSMPLLPTEDMYNFFENGIRGGMCFINKHYIEANNEEVEGYNKNKPIVGLTYLDENNLYGNALRSKLPCGEFKWINITEEDVINYNEESGYGVILEVDLEYTEIAKEKSLDLPYAPEHKIISEDMLTPYMLRTYEHFKPSKKLLLSHYDKKII